MYHFDISSGESPDFATVKEAPLESYVGLPCGVKESDAPAVKSILTAFPSAGFGGQLPPCKGLQVEYVCAVTDAERYRAAMAR